ENKENFECEDTQLEILSFC
ncbi:hypothetical protein CEXT_344381, partial [Caerostris extrusa]